MFNKPILYRTLAFVFALSLSVLYAVHHLNNGQTNDLDEQTNRQQLSSAEDKTQKLSVLKNTKPADVAPPHTVNEKPLDLSLPSSTWKGFQSQAAMAGKQPVIKLQEESGLKAGSIEVSPSVDVRPLSAMDRTKPLDNIEGMGVDMKITVD